MSNKPKEEQEEKAVGDKPDEDIRANLLVLLGIIILVWLLSWWALSSLHDQLSNRGLFGDSFGAINSLFSGLALAGIIYTIFLQKKELSLQREELRETRKEFKTQNITLRLQRFENTFFNLVSLHHQIVNSIDSSFEKQKGGMDNILRRKIQNEPADYERITLKGQDVFRRRYEKLIAHLKEDELDLNTAYLTYYEKVQTDFGHYFRNLYRIIKLVHETEFHTHEELGASTDTRKYAELIKYGVPNSKTAYKYTSIIRAQLSDYELLWLFYNCLSSNGNKKFKPLIERYALLKNMPQDKLHEKELLKEYEATAYHKAGSE